MVLKSDSWHILADLLHVSTPDAYASDFERIKNVAEKLPAEHSYLWLGELGVLFNQYKEEHGESVAELHARQLLLDFLPDSAWRPRCRVPPSVLEQLSKERERIEKEVFEKSPGHYSPSADGFYKDFSLLRGKALPIFTGIVDTHTALWRRPLLVGSLSQRINFLRFLMKPPVGTRYFLTHHTHTSLLANFNPEGWRKTYKLVADILELNADHKGFAGASWFYDPQLEDVSPRLTYLAKEPLDAGAFRFFVEKDLTGSALATSVTRKALHEQGKYTPLNYLLLWDRKQILKWRDTR